MPPSGTFFLIPTSLVSGGTPFVPTGTGGNNYAGWQGDPGDSVFGSLSSPPFIGPSSATLQIGAENDFGFCVPFVVFNQVVRLDFGGASIYLDGSLTPITFASLPPGFIPTLAEILFIPIDLIGSGSINYFMQSDALTEGAANTPLILNSPPLMINLMNNGMGIRFNLSAPSPCPSEAAIIGMYGACIFGTYVIEAVAMPFTLQNADVPIYVGDKIKVSTTPPIVIDHNDPNPPPGVLQGVQEIHFDYTDFNGIAQTVIIDENSFSTYVIVQDSNNIWFYLPIGFGTFAGSVVISFVGDGVQFSGSVTVGTLQILYEDASGIYSLMKNQTDDVLYVRAGFTTDIRLIMLSDANFQDEIDEESFFNLLPYPRKILAQTNCDEDLTGDSSDFFITAILRSVVITKDVEIPSPFIKTAFLP